MSGSESDETEDETGAAQAEPGARPSGGQPTASTALPPKMEAWRRRSAAGAILTGFALGLQEALEPKRDEPTISVQTSADPPSDLPVEAEFEYRRPRRSVISIRPWLLHDQDPGPGEDSDAERPEEGEP